MSPPPALVLVSELRLGSYVTASGKDVSNHTWSAALATTLEKIQGDGLAVVSLHGVPFDDVDPSQCIAANPKRLSTCAVKVRMADVRGWDAATLDGARAAHAGSVGLDPLFCGSSACPVVVDGAVTHSGSNHVTERYAKDVRSAFAELLGCLVADSFTNASKADPLFNDLNGPTPSAEFLGACTSLQP
jgi:hypothetical protein